MPGDMALSETGLGSVALDGRAYLTTVTLSSGSATLTYTDIDGIDVDPASEPYVMVTGPTGGETVTSKGTTQCTIGGDTTDDVECLVVFPQEG